MSEYNKYINSFANEAEYETYTYSPIAETPNTALIDDTSEIKIAKYLPKDYVMLGTTSGTKDFKIGQSSSENSSANCIHVHVVVKDKSGINKMYVSPVDVLSTPKYFYSNNNGFDNTEGNKILSIKKWKIDTSQVTNIIGMFSSCSKLTTLDLSSFNTSNVTDMSSMFWGCGNLTTLDLSSFNTSKVTNIGHMFSNCSSLTTLDLSNFNTRKVTNLNYMFNACSKINKLYLSSGFFNSTSLTTYDFSSLSNWTDTESLAMFVEAITAHNGTGKTVQLSRNTKNALTTEQKTAITNAGWTIA